MLTMMSQYLGHPLDPGLNPDLVTYTRNRIDITYLSGRAVRGGLQCTFIIFDHDKTTDPSPLPSCEPFTHWYTFTGQLWLYFLNSKGRRRRTSERLLPVKITWNEAFESHYVSPMCGTWPYPCREPLSPPFDTIDLVIELDRIEKLATNVVGSLEDTLLDGLVTNSEKLGEYIAEVAKREKEECYEVDSSISPPEWRCISGNCAGDRGSPYPRGMLTSICDDKPCPPGYNYSAVDCECVPRPCPPCPEGFKSRGEYPNCECYKDNEPPGCPPGQEVIDGECSPPPEEDPRQICWTCDIIRTIQPFATLGVLTPMGDGETIHSDVSIESPDYVESERHSLSCGKLSVDIQRGSEQLGFPQAILGKTYYFGTDYSAEWYIPRYMRLYSTYDNGSGVEVKEEQVVTFYDWGPYSVFDGSNLGPDGIYRIIDISLSCFETGREFDPDAPRFKRDFPVRPRLRKPVTQETGLCNYVVTIEVNLAVVAVRRAPQPGIPNSYYENINFAALPHIGITLGPFDLTTFQAPCWLDNSTLRSFYDQMVELANQFVDQAFDSLLVAAFGPPGVLLGKLVDIAVYPKITRRP